MNADDFQRMAGRARIRERLRTPLILLRTTMLKLALRTGDLNGLTAEAIPVYRLSVPLAGRYLVCLRSPDRIIRLVAETAVERHSYEGLPACKLRFERLRFPRHTITVPWLEEADQHGAHETPAAENR